MTFKSLVTSLVGQNVKWVLSLEVKPVGGALYAPGEQNVMRIGGPGVKEGDPGTPEAPALRPTGWWYSEDGVDVTDQDDNPFHADARMAVDSPPVLQYDPYSGTIPASNARVSIFPSQSQEYAIQDLADRNNFDWSEIVATLYRYITGDKLSVNGDVAIVGTVDNFSLTEDGTFSFDIIDFSGVRYNQAFPKIKIWSKTFDTLGYTVPPDTEGRGLPIWYGYVAEMEVPVIDTAGNGKIGLHTNPASITNIQADGTDTSGNTKARVSDEDGNKVTAVTNSDAGNPIGATTNASITGYGEPDYSGKLGGTKVSGVTNKVIMNMAAIVLHMGRFYSGIPWEYIDKKSFVDVGKDPALLRSIQFSRAFSATEETRFADVCGELSLLGGCMMGYWERGKMRARGLLRGQFNDFDLDSRNVIAVEDISWTNTDDIVNEILIRYRYAYSDKEPAGFDYQKSYLLNGRNFQPFKQSQAKYGVRRITLDLKELYFANAAALIARNIGYLKYKPRAIAKVRGDQSTHTINLGDKGRWTYDKYPSSDGTGCTKKKFVGIGIEKGLTDNLFTLLEA